MVKCEIMLALLWPLLPPIISQKLSENGVVEKMFKKRFEQASAGRRRPCRPRPRTSRKFPKIPGQVDLLSGLFEQAVARVLLQEISLLN